jgi:hypothetical protein
MFGSLACRGQRRIWTQRVGTGNRRLDDYRLDCSVLHLFRLGVLIHQGNSAAGVRVLGGIESGELRVKPLLVFSAFEQLGNEMLVDDSTDELSRTHLFAVAILPMLDEETSSVELFTAHALQLLIKFVALGYVSVRLRH